MRRVDLPDGWIEVREPADLTVAHRNMLRSALGAAQGALSHEDSDDPAQAYKDGLAYALVNSVVILALVVRWSFDIPLPTTLEQVKNLPAQVGNQVDLAVAEPGADAFMYLRGADFSPRLAAEMSDPKARSGSSRSSAGSSKARARKGSASPTRSRNATRSGGSAR